MKYKLTLLLFLLLCGTTAAYGQDVIENDTASTVTEEQPERWGVVNLSANYLRSRPDYESSLESQTLMGTVVKILDESGYWLKVETRDYVAWCTNLGIVEMSAEELEQYVAAPKYICTAWHSRVFSEPTEKSQKICEIVEGDQLLQVLGGKKGDKALIEKGFAVVSLPNGTQGYVPKKDLEDYETWKAACNPTAENIIAEAMKFLGTPYLWGGASPNSVDCSGFVQHVYRMNGITIPRNSNQQFRAGKDIPLPMTLNLVYDDEGRRQQMIQKLSQVRPGDLVFFGRNENGRIITTHVGLYMGDYKMIHSSHIVRINSLLPGDEDCYANYERLIGAVRFLPDD